METVSPEEKVATLLASFEVGAPDERRSALQQIKSLGADAVTAVPALLGALRDADLAIRPEAAAALVAMGAPVVRPIIEAMLEPDPDFRRALLLILGSIGPDAAEARPVIEAACQDEQLGRLAEKVRRIVCPTWRDRWRSRIGPSWVWGVLVGVVAVLAGILALLVRVGGEWFPETSRTVLTISAALGIIGVATGALGGASRWGVPGALLGAMLFGLAGGYVGYVAGRLTDGVLRPLIESFVRH